jgi:hypothetical protein
MASGLFVSRLVVTGEHVKPREDALHGTRRGVHTNGHDCPVEWTPTPEIQGVQGACVVARRLLRRCKKIKCSTSPWIKLIVPIAMKLVSLQCQALHVGFGDLDASWVVVLVQLRLDAKPLAGSGTSDEVDDRLEARERFSSPVLCNVAEEPVFDLVPFARARREK